LNVQQSDNIPFVATDPADTEWLSESEQRLWRSFLDVNRLLFEHLDQQLQRHAGLPHAYYALLVCLSEAPDGAMRMSELAAQTLSSPSRASHAVGRLEHEGWVERRRCDGDGRGTLAAITPDGRSKLAAAAPGHVATVRSALFERLSPTQQDQLGAICTALRDGLAEPHR
jgi:DNA-binding MarR family transcriptional regulator